MKFTLTFKWKPDTKAHDEGMARFKKKKGGHSPQGVKLLGRRTRAEFSGGFDLLEADDLESSAELSLRWSDLMDLELYPILEDQDLLQVLGRIQP